MAIGDLVFCDGQPYVVVGIEPETDKQGIALGYSDWVNLHGAETIWVRMEDIDGTEYSNERGWHMP